MGSFPNAATFFVVYESVKRAGEAKFADSPAALHLIAGAAGETAACFGARADRKCEAKDAGRYVQDDAGCCAEHRKRSRWRAPRILHRLLYYCHARAAVCCHPIPTVEKLKVLWAAQCDRPIYAHESALCGSVSGAVAAALTTPLDVIKTRLMLGADANGVKYVGTVSTAKRIVRDEGAAALMRGLESRVAWISIGGFVFFYAYEFATRKLTRAFHA